MTISLNVLITVVLVIAGCFIAGGLFNFALIVFNVPSSKTTRAIKNISRQQKITNKSFDNYYNDLSLFLSKFIVMSEYKKAHLAENLKIANIAMTPELFTARAIVKAVGIGLFAVPIYFLVPILALADIILAILVFNQEKQRVADCIKKKRDEINADLPRFVYAISQELQSDHDVLSILERHKDNFSDSFNSEIAITIADMRSGNYEAALQRFEGRIGSTSLSDVVRGLIDMTRGDDTHVYWETLAIRFSEMQKQALRKIANKVPIKVHKLSFFLMMSIIIVYVVVLGYQLLINMSILF